MTIKDQHLPNIKNKDNIKSKSFWWNIGLKLVFTLVLLLFLYRQVFQNQDLSQSWNLFLSNIQKGSLGYLMLCIMLMPLNWYLESSKWRILVLPFERISRWKSFEAILSGVSVALLTPNRIGEYGGRMVMVEAKNNWKAVVSTLVSSYAQNIWNIGIGLIAAILFLYNTNNIEGYLFISGLIIGVIFLVLLLILFFNIGIVNNFFQKIRRYNWINKALKHTVLLDEYKWKTLLSVLILAFIRYGIYFLQYYLILRFFGMEISFLAGLIGIATIFLVQTSLPLPPLLGFLARGEIALLVWENLYFNELSVLAASYSLWFINLIFPALIGSIIILSSNLWRSFGLSQWIIRRK